MSVRVYKGNIQVEDFKFNEIVSSQTLGNTASEFKLSSLNNVSQEDPKVKDQRIRRERIAESNSSFVIDNKVREYRGLREQEELDYENRVNDDVNRKVDKIKEKAYEDGFQEGFKKGHEQSYNETTSIFEEKINLFIKQLEDTLSKLNDVYDKNKNDAFMMVKNLSKWVVLKEVDEKQYLERLLEKLILEIKTKNNLLIRVNKSSFEYMPELVEKVQERVGPLSNIRIEIELDLQDPGIILESENSIIDGSLKAQFESLDKLFENIGVVESNES